jgi:hypothetical protein
MPTFRYYCLNDDGRIAFGKHIEADDLHTAIRSAHEECSTHPAGPFQGVEIWQEGTCLFTTGDQP